MLNLVKQMMTMSRWQGDLDALELIQCAPMPEELQKPARRISKRQQCFRNALLLATEIGQEAKYCVGYAFPTCLPAPIEHAWIEIGDGKMHDPTWELFGELGAGYVTIVKLSPAEAFEAMEAWGNSLAPALYEILNLERRRERCA